MKGIQRGNLTSNKQQTRLVRAVVRKRKFCTHALTCNRCPPIDSPLSIINRLSLPGSLFWFVNVLCVNTRVLRFVNCELFLFPSHFINTMDNPYNSMTTPQKRKSFKHKIECKRRYICNAYFMKYL